MVFVKKALVANIVAQIAGKVVLSVIGLFVITQLCRYLSVDAFGSYTLAFSIVGFFCPLVDMGMNTIAVREISQGRASGASLLTGILLIKLALTVVSIIIIVLVCLAMDYPPEVRLMTIMASLTLVSTMLGTFEIYLIVLQKMYILVVSQVVSNLVLLGAVIYMIKSGSLLQVIILTQVACAALTYLIIIIAIHREIVFKKPDVTMMLPFGKSSMQQGVSSIIVSYFNSIDMVIISKLVGTGAVAYYGAAYRIVGLMIFVPHAVMMSLYPILLHFKSKNDQDFNLVFRFSFYILMLVAIPTATWITLYADPLIRFIYTGKYEHAVPALQILVWSGVFTFASFLAGYTIIIIHRQWFGIYVSLAALVVNVILNLLLIPLYGIKAAAIVTVITECCVSVMLYLYLYMYEKILPFSIKLIRVFFAVCGTVMVSLLMQNSHVLVAAAVFSLFLALFIGAYCLGTDRAIMRKCSLTG